MATLTRPPRDHENVLLSDSYRVKPVSSSSCMKGSNAKNVLNSDDAAMWMSEPGLPQSIVLDLGNNFKNHDGHTLKRNYSWFAFHCCHAYSSNPSRIELNYSVDGT